MQEKEQKYRTNRTVNSTDCIYLTITCRCSDSRAPPRTMKDVKVQHHFSPVKLWSVHWHPAQLRRELSNAEYYSVTTYDLSTKNPQSTPLQLSETTCTHRTFAPAAHLAEVTDSGLSTWNCCFLVCPDLCFVQNKRTHSRYYNRMNRPGRSQSLFSFPHVVLLLSSSSILLRPFWIWERLADKLLPGNGSQPFISASPPTAHQVSRRLHPSNAPSRQQKAPQVPTGRPAILPCDT